MHGVCKKIYIVFGNFYIKCVISDSMLKSSLISKNAKSLLICKKAKI